MAEVISDLNINLVLVEDGQAFAYRQFLSNGDGEACKRLPRHVCTSGTP